MKCKSCDHKIPDGLLRCTHCGQWHIIDVTSGESNAMSLYDVEASDVNRIVSGPWDSCFGGGIVRDSLNFFAGEPGAGKSTLLLWIASSVVESERRSVLYIGKEETMGAIKARALRLKMTDDAMKGITLVSQHARDLYPLLKHHKPCLVIVDSLPALAGLGGGHLDAATGAMQSLREYADAKKCPSLIVDQVNKELDFYGEMSLQHFVDATLMMSVDKSNDSMRYLTTRKNRFGPAGIREAFTMVPAGLVHVPANWLPDESDAYTKDDFKRARQEAHEKNDMNE